jgi:transcriptional regulator GlxA family with amidase domain
MMGARVAAVRSGSPLIARLHAYLRTNLRSPLRDAARTLGLSSRTLQRRLREEGTSFQREQGTLRVRVAKDLMMHTNHDLKRIAFGIGCASPQQFTTLFHTRVGEPPSAWRERARREQGDHDSADEMTTHAVEPCTMATRRVGLKRR